MRGLDEFDRRTLVLGGATVAAAAVVGGVAAGAAAGLGRMAGGAQTPGGQSVTLTAPHPSASSASPITTVPGSTTPSAAAPTPTTATPTTATPTTATPTTAAPAGTPIGLASQVRLADRRASPIRTGDPGLVLQPAKGRFVAYNAICPHAGCTVGYSPAASLIVCPCHGSEFDPNTGAVVAPPASHGLRSIQVAVDAKGELVVDD